MTTAYPQPDRQSRTNNVKQGKTQLTPLERRTIRYIHRAFGHSPFVLEQFLQEAPLESPPAEWRVGLISLCRKQIVSIYRKTWGERMFQIPIADYIGQFSIWVPQLYEIAEHMPCNNIFNLTAWHNTMPQRLLWLVLEVEREALHFTRKGKLLKRDQERLRAKIGIDYGEHHSEQLSEQERLLQDDRALGEVLDLALRLGLVRRDQELIIVDGQRFTDWLALDARLREQELFLLWYRVHCPDHPALHWMTGAVRNLPDEQWMSMDSLFQIMVHHGVEGSLPDIEDWMIRLHTAGWIEHAVDEYGQRYVRINPTRPEEQRTLLVQHDMEIILYPSTPFSVIRMLHQFAVRVPAAGVERYRITAKSVQQAYDQGWDSEAIEHMLGEHSIDDVIPEQVLNLIREWETSRTVVRLVPGVILYAGTEQASSALRWNAERLGLQSINEQYWIAPKGQEREVMRQLQSLGCEVVTPAGAQELSGQQEDAAETYRTSEQPVARRISSGTDRLETVEQALHPQAPGLFKPQDTSTLYRKEFVDIGSEEMFPDYQGIPAIWHQQYRSYHPYTAKQILEQAIRWQTSVRMLASKDEHDFIPRKIEEAEGTWLVDGYCASQPMRLRVDEIEKLQLLIPSLDT